MLRLATWAALVAVVGFTAANNLLADPGEFPNFEAAARQAGNQQTERTLPRDASRHVPLGTQKAAISAAATTDDPNAVRPAQSVAPQNALRDKTANRPAAAEQPIPAAQSNAGEAEILAAYELTQSAETDADFTAIIEQLQAGLERGVDKQMAAYARKLNAWAHNKRGEARAAADLPEDALEDFEAAVSLDNKHWRAVNNRGVSRAIMGDAAGAIADFSRVLELNPKFASAYFNRGEMRYERRDFAGAIADYTQALKLSPRDVAAFNSRGHAFYRLGRQEQALADYNRALQIDPGHAAALVNRGDLHADLGNFAAAAEDYRSAISANPDFGRAYQSAAWLMATCPDARFREAELAIEIAQKAIELDGGGDYRYLETLSAAQANAGEFEIAVQTLNDAIQLAPAAVGQVYQARIAKFQAGQPHREPAKKLASPQTPVANVRGARRG